MTSQLLSEMPAEGAARLLTLSLIERLSQHATVSAGNGDPTGHAYDAAAYHAGLRRLRTCLTLYAEALGSSVPRKARRGLRELADAAERLRHIDVQLAWGARHVPRHDQRLAGEPLGDGPYAAAWLCDRIGRRRARGVRALARAQGDGRTLRRIAKRLGVYTTAVRLDAIPTHQSFAEITGEQLRTNADTLAASARAVRAPNSYAELRRALRSVERLSYLAEPLRAYADIDEASVRLGALRSALELLEDTAMIARAVVRGGRRLAADHTGNVLRTTIWPTDGESLDGNPGNGRMPHSPADLQHGFLVLAETLHDEVTRSFHELEATWLSGAIEQLVADVLGIAERLRGA